ncbi:hypothetical protein LX36DRAFT_391605 [Colletotrichum falcatum]|nr:hypothetical protein LX36DRAFT_391605 [Colletotrichum falcatum]
MAQPSNALLLTSHRPTKIHVSEEAGAEAMEYVTWRLLNGRCPHSIANACAVPSRSSNPSIPHVPDKLISPTRQSLPGSSPLLPPLFGWSSCNHLIRPMCILMCRVTVFFGLSTASTCPSIVVRSALSVLLPPKPPATDFPFTNPFQHSSAVGADNYSHSFAA